MKKILFILSIIASSFSLSAQTLPWCVATVPSSPPQGFNESKHVLKDTLTHRDYIWRSGAWRQTVAFTYITGLTGATGATGPAGTSIKTGTGVPSGSTGKTGDMYIDLNTDSLYGPKSGGIWGPAKACLQGADGATGPAGANGTNGTAATLHLAVTALPFGSPPSATNIGNSTAADYIIGIPGGAPGSNGTNGTTPTFSTGITTTGSPGSSASLTVVGAGPAYTINASIPAGIQGPPGASGGGSGTAGWMDNTRTSPDKYFATHDSSTIASHGWTTDSITAKWPGSGATTASLVDWAAWQMAVNEANTTGKTIVGYGTYYVKDTILFPTYPSSRIKVLNAGKIFMCGTVSCPIFGRTSPTNLSDANTQISITSFSIVGTEFKANPTAKCVGINLGPMQHTTISGCRFYNLDTAIVLRFALGTYISDYEINNAGSGSSSRMGIWIGCGNYPGTDASSSSSQSNRTVCYQGRIYMESITATGIKIDGCSGVNIMDLTLEGSGFDKGIWVDQHGATTTHDGAFSHIHFEPNPNGANSAAIYIRSDGGIYTLDVAFGQYASILIDAASSGSGTLSIHVQHIYAWLPRSNKYFTSGNSNVQWYLEWNDNLYDPPTAGDLASKFNGTVSQVTFGSTGNGSSSHVESLYTPR